MTSRCVLLRRRLSVRLSLRTSAPSLSPSSRQKFVCPRACVRAQLMYKLRKELGDDDFKAIFEDPRVKGPKGMPGSDIRMPGT